MLEIGALPGGVNLWSIGGQRSSSSWPADPQLALPQQRDEAGGRRNIGGERPAAFRLFGILAPGFDLKTLVELRGGKSLLRIDAPLEQCQAQHERSARGGRQVERRQHEIIELGYRGGKRSEAVRRLARRDDPGGHRERRVVAQHRPVDERLPHRLLASSERRGAY